MNNSCSSRLILVTGGAASGKSVLGERICRDCGGRLLYVAAMKPQGDEAAKRIRQHRELRDGKGFETLECYENLSQASFAGRYRAALLEDTGNLTANELFDNGKTPRQAVDEILDGVGHLMCHANTVVVVGNNVFSGRESGNGNLEDYGRCLGELHYWLAEQADVMAEAVCGIPLFWKGELAL